MAIDPKLLIIKPVSQLQNEPSPLNAKVLMYNGGGELKTTPLDDLKSLISAGVKGILKISDAKPSPSAVGKYDLSEVGTYTNLVPIIAVGSSTSSNTPITTLATDLNSVYWDGVNFTQFKKSLPQATQSIIRFTDSTFPLVAPAPPAPPIQRTHENAIYQLADGQTATVGDVPGVSSKWIEIGKKTLWRCKEYQLNKGIFTTGRYMNDNGTFTNGTGGLIEIPITPNLWGLPIYIDGWDITKFSSSVGAGNYGFYDTSNALVENGGVAFYGRYNIIPKNTAKLIIGIARLIAPTQDTANRIKVSISFNRINEDGVDIDIENIRTIANAVATGNIVHNNLAMAKGGRTIANLTNPAGFYFYGHVDTQIVEVTPKDKILYVHKISNNLPIYGAVFYDKNWDILSNSNSIVTKGIPNAITESTISVSYNGVNETVYITPFALPANCRYVVFGILTNTQDTDRVRYLTTIAKTPLTPADFPAVYNYEIEKFNDIKSFKDRFDLRTNEEYSNIASQCNLISDSRYNSEGVSISGGQNVVIPVVQGGVITVMVSIFAVSSSEIGFGVYEDSSGNIFPLTKSNYSRVVVGNNGDTFYQAFRIITIIPQNNWVNVKVNTTTSNANYFFAVFRRIYDGVNIPLLNDRMPQYKELKPYYNKLTSYLGDSIIHQMLWQRGIYFKNGMAPDYTEIRSGKNGFRPTAVGGSMIYPGLTSGVVTTPAVNNSITCRADDLINYNPNLIVIMGGRNDLGKGVVIGNYSDAPLLDYNAPPMTSGIAYNVNNVNDVTGAIKTDLSFSSCYRGMLIKLMQSMPATKIICMTPIGGNDGLRNALELRNISKVIVEICRDYGVQVIDSYSGVNINRFTYSSLAPDGVHPNQAGADLITNYSNANV